MQNSPELTNKRDYLVAFSLVFLCYSGIVKATPFFSWLPVDLTALSATAVILALLASSLSGDLPGFSATFPTIALWSLFLPGALLAYMNGYNQSKYQLLFSVTLLCAIAASSLLYSPRRQKAWLDAHIAFGVLIIVGLYVFPAVQSEANQGRLGVYGSTSISTAWILCAAALISTHRILSAKGASRWGWALAGSAFAIAAILIGSRGPIVALLAAVAMVGAITFRERRLFSTIALSSALLFPFGLAYLLMGESLPAARIFELFAGNADGSGRNVFYDIALDSVATNPFGLGWGGYSSINEVIFLSGSYETYAHNIILDIGVDGGIFAALGFLVYFFRPIAFSLRRPVGNLPIIAGLSTFWFVAALFSSDINGNRMLWAAGALAFGAIWHYKQNASQYETARKVN